MANLKGLDADSADAYIAASGAGTDLDPLVLKREITASALPTGAATAALQSALEAIFAAITDVVNGVMLAEINVLDRTEDSITAYAEDVSFSTATLTTTTATSIISAPAAGNHLVIKKFSYQIREAAAGCIATLRAGSGGTDVMAYDLDFTGAEAPTTVGIDFGAGGYPLATATALYGKLAAAGSTGGVRFNVWHVTRPD